MKYFFDWHFLKIHIERKPDSFQIFNEKEIWWCSLGVNIGSEQDGKNQSFERPVLVLRKFNQTIAWVLPLSSKCKEGSHYHTLQHDNSTYSVLLSQLRLVSSKRFIRKIRKISAHDFRVIKDKIVILLKVQCSDL